jgi:hypothetical protein
LGVARTIPAIGGADLPVRISIDQPVNRRVYLN